MYDSAVGDMQDSKRYTINNNGRPSTKDPPARQNSSNKKSPCTKQAKAFMHHLLKKDLNALASHSIAR